MSVDDRVQRESVLPRFGEVPDLHVRVSFGLHLRPEQQGVLGAPAFLGILGIDDNVLDLNESLNSFPEPFSKDSSGIRRRVYTAAQAQHAVSRSTWTLNGHAGLREVPLSSSFVRRREQWEVNTRWHTLIADQLR